MDIDRIPSSPPLIAPVPGDDKRPLWSVMIPAYNCSNFLAATIKSVVAQAPEPEKMQIEVVDDCSTDADVRAIVHEAGKGRVSYYRKEKNMGSIRNFETCINRARGQLIHILHGDDLVADGFYKEQEMLFEQFPQIGAAFTDFNFINSEGEVLYTEGRLADKPGVMKDWLLYIATRQRIQPPAMVVRRSVYEHLGGFFAVKYGEDWEMWARIAAHYPVAHSPEILASYRVHNNSITGSSLTTGQNIKDIKKVMDIIGTYLPQDKRRSLRKDAEKKFSIYFAWLSHKLYHDLHDRQGAIRQINGALSLSRNRTTVTLALKLYLKLLIRY